MKIVVCVKQVPNPKAEVTVENGKASWGNAKLIISTWDAIAVEAALQQKEKRDGTVTAISIGDQQAEVALRGALGMGVDSTLLISHQKVDTIDTQGIARILAATIQKIGSVDLVFFGKQTTDREMGVIPAQTARLLGWPALTSASKVETKENFINIERTLEERRQAVRTKLPAVVSVNKDFGDPRPITPIQDVLAYEVEIPVWSLNDLGVATPVSLINWVNIMNMERVKCEIISGDTLKEMAEKMSIIILKQKRA